MKTCIKYPSIEQFRNIISGINRKYTFDGLDESGEPIYRNDLPKPTLKFKGTVKLHGTNSGVSYNDIDGIWYQSRENIITPQKDNVGFAFFAESNKDSFLKLINQIQLENMIDLIDNTITIYGEWVGKSIQRGVGISNLEKSMFVFGVKISPFVIEGEEKPRVAYWVNHQNLRCPENKIYNINDYQTYEIDINFNMPQLVQNKLSELTIAVENECPISKAFGFPNTVGEGIVWSCDFNDIRYSFKVKGEKHSNSKVKTLASVDTDKLNSIVEFIEYAVTENRFKQALENAFHNNEPIDIKKIGDVIRWVINDVIKEEIDTMSKNNIEPKEVNRYISDKVRNMFFNLSI